MNHGLIKELQAKKRRALCVVIGVVKTTKPTSITADLDMKVKASTKVCLPVLPVHCILYISEGW